MQLSSTCQVHQALFPVEELEALASEFRRDEEMREKEEGRVALKRQQFEESLVGAPVVAANSSPKT